MATTVSLGSAATSRPSGAMNYVGGAGSCDSVKIFPPVAANTLILSGDLLVDTGIYNGGTGTSTPPASATGVAQGVAIITQSGANFTQTATNTTSAAALQGAIHDALLGVSESYRPYSVVTTGTVRDFASVGTSGFYKFSLVPSVLDGSSYTGQGTAAVVGQLVTVAISAINGSNYFPLLDSTNLPYVEIIPFGTEASGAGIKVAIGYVAKPVSTTDTSVVVNIKTQVFGGMPQPVV